MKVLTKPDEACFIVHRKYLRCPLQLSVKSGKSVGSSLVAQFSSGLGNNIFIVLKTGKNLLMSLYLCIFAKINNIYAYVRNKEQGRNSYRKERRYAL